jgi:hypothetical protein
MYEILTNVELPKIKKPNRIKADKLNRKIQKRINFKNWEANNKHRRKDWKRKWKLENPDKLKIHARRAQLKRKYNITLEKYNELLSLQNGHCFFCDRTPEQERYGVLCVDHCHKTNRIRGLLCITHNRSLGVFGDNEEGLLKALTYVRGE